MDTKKVEMNTESLDREEEFVSEVVVEEEKFTPVPEENKEEWGENPKKERGEALKKAKSVLKAVFFAALWIAIGYLLGLARLPFGAAFLGVALLCAASSKVGYIYTGLVFSTIFGKEWALVSFCAYTATLFIRVLSRILIDPPSQKIMPDDTDTIVLSDVFPILFAEHIFLRMASASVGAFIIGIYSLASGGFLYYDLFGLIIGVLGAPVAVYLLAGLSGNGGAIGTKGIEGAYVSEGRRFAGLVSLLAALVVSAKDIDLFGMSLSLFAATFITLYFCRRKGLAYGLIAGVVMGLVYSPMLAPSFAFAAISSGVLFAVSTFFACLSACTVSVAWALYVDGISALSTALPATLAASLLFAVIEKLYFSELFANDLQRTGERSLEKDSTAERQKKECEVLGRENLDALVLDDTEQRVKVMCETFSSLSSLFYSLSERMRVPATQDLHQICDNAFDSFCHSCEMRSTCWESEYASSLAAVGKMSASLGTCGHIDIDDVSRGMRERCSSIKDIVAQINRNSTAHTQQLIIGDKTEIFALDYEAISELLAAVMTSQREDFEYSEELSQAARSLILEKGFDPCGVFVFGNARRRNIFVRFRNEGELYKSRNALINAFEKLYNESLYSRINENDPREMILASAPKYRIDLAKRSIKAEGEEGFCGDTINIFESERDIFYSFISDGMGAGRDAALTSSICSVFLSKVLGATGKCEIALEMLNGFLRNKGSTSLHECSATVDLLEYDLVTGKARFHKSGAAPSYIYRGGNLFKLRSNTVPLGIIKELDTKKITIDTAEGDIIVMVSDGVTQSREECPWLFDLLKVNAEKESLSSIADMIVKRAKYEGATDDISVVVMKVMGV